MPLPFLLPRMALVAMLAGAASPALPAEIEPLPDGSARARIIGLKLYHDPKEWLIDGEGESFGVFCRGPECKDPLMTIVAVPEELTSCSPGAVIDRSALDYPDAWTRQATHAAAIGLTVHVATLDQGCRNRAGSPVYACTTYQGLDLLVHRAGRDVPHIGGRERGARGSPQRPQRGGTDRPMIRAMMLGADALPSLIAGIRPAG